MVSHIVVIVAVYATTRWLMFFPRSPWSGESTDWTERILYQLTFPSSFGAPEITAAGIALGVTIFASYSAIFGQALPHGIAAACINLGCFSPFVVGAITGAGGLLGVAFFSWTIGNPNAGRTDEYNAEELIKDLVARDSSATVLVTGLILVATSFILMWFYSCTQQVLNNNTRNDSITGD